MTFRLFQTFVKYKPGWIKSFEWTVIFLGSTFVFCLICLIFVSFSVWILWNQCRNKENVVTQQYNTVTKTRKPGQHPKSRFICKTFASTAERLGTCSVQHVHLSAWNSACDVWSGPFGTKLVDGVYNNQVSSFSQLSQNDVKNSQWKTHASRRPWERIET